MTTPIKINADPSLTDLNRFNEDITDGKYRIGRKINRDRNSQRVLAAPSPGIDSIPASLLTRVDIAKIVEITNKNLSGITLEYLESGLDEEKINVSILKEGENIIAKDFGKVRQGVSVRSTFDLHSDMLPFVYIQGGRSPYPANIHQRFFSSFDEDFFGFKTQLDRKNFVPYEDIIDLNPTYLSASTYLQISNPYDVKIYPKYSGSHYTSPYQLNGIIEPFDITSTRHEVKLIDQVSSFTARRYIAGISATIMGSEREHTGRGKAFRVKTGVVSIDDKYANENNFSDQVEAFEDSLTINRLSLNTLLPISTPESNFEYEYRSFNDTKDYLSDINSYTHLNNKSSQSIFLSGSMRSISEIGTRYRSARSGFVYESTTLGNTTLGTDSIAFGGLKRS